MSKPLVSVIIPCYNVEKYICECLDSVIGQTEKNIEILCIDDGSTDNTVSIIKKYMEKDSRISFYNQENKGAGAARNLGISHSNGEYLYFCDSDDICHLDLIEKCLLLANKENADIVAFNSRRFSEDGSTLLRNDVHIGSIPKGVKVFSYVECPDSIMGIINPTPWNKFYNAKFVKDNNFKFEEIPISNDITFSSVTLANASRITYMEDVLYEYRWGAAGTITSQKKYKLMSVVQAIESAERQVRNCSHFDFIRRSYYRFCVEIYSDNFKKFGRDFSIPGVKQFYESMYKCFTQRDFMNIKPEDLGNKDYYDWLKLVQSVTPDEMEKIVGKEIIVSFTSFPERLKSVHVVVESILKQTVQADKILLYLSKEQFPKQEKSLTPELKALVANGKMQIIFVKDDLKPHKKYYYAMQQYPDSIVITIDDDVNYSQKTIERLWRSYLKFPKAVHACRTSGLLTENRKVCSYKTKLNNQDVLIGIPSSQLLAVGVGGVLYPPHVFDAQKRNLFNVKLFKRLCHSQDDLWLKAMELLCDVPVVQCFKNEGQKYVDGTQEFGLWLTVNSKIKEGEMSPNDIAFEKIRKWANSSFKPQILFDKMMNPVYSEGFITEALKVKYFENRIKDAESNKSKMKKEYDAMASKIRFLEKQFKEKEEKRAEFFGKTKERDIRIKSLLDDMKKKDLLIKEYKNNMDKVVTETYLSQSEKNIFDSKYQEIDTSVLANHYHSFEQTLFKENFNISKRKKFLQNILPASFFKINRSNYHVIRQITKQINYNDTVLLEQIAALQKRLDELGVK